MYAPRWRTWRKWSRRQGNSAPVWVNSIRKYQLAFAAPLAPKFSTAHHKIYCPAIHVVWTSSVSRLARSATTTPLVAVGQNERPNLGLQSEGTTAGDIAASVIAIYFFAAEQVQGCFALSADDSLRENGKVTGINWAANYELYLKYLTTGLEKCKTSVLKIFSTCGAENNGGSTVDAMDLLNADAEEEPEDGGEDG
ncbi:hypothetical protein DFH08DRAFT_813548 [Mycena albidolilacea]|uniref:Uncharacterized protein n=1 Tax=Mycena albidolilacea TaxID=1033008 RepID=A0AAD6ZRZ3_9AGAR|nr:hypothetical protein DFH08DRAFT_813548 [Mycena albidolilacea]